MSKPSFIYITYINTTPEKLWQALTDGETTRKYWVNHRNARIGRWARRGGTRILTIRAWSTSSAK